MQREEPAGITVSQLTTKSDTSSNSILNHKLNARVTKDAAKKAVDLKSKKEVTTDTASITSEPIKTDDSKTS